MFMYEKQPIFKLVQILYVNRILLFDTVLLDLIYIFF